MGPRPSLEYGLCYESRFLSSPLLQILKPKKASLLQITISTSMRIVHPTSNNESLSTPLPLHPLLTMSLTLEEEPFVTSKSSHSSMTLPKLSDQPIAIEVMNWTIHSLPSHQSITWPPA
eukprot:Gb_37584 [translate_table: standard]